MTLRSAISMTLVLQMLITSVLGPNFLCLCSDGCITIEVEADQCCSLDECGSPVASDVIAAASDSCCEWCFTIPGDSTVKLLAGSGSRQISKDACQPVLATHSPSHAFDQHRADRTVIATGPPPAIVHLRTVRLLI